MVNEELAPSPSFGLLVQLSAGLLPRCCLSALPLECFSWLSSFALAGQGMQQSCIASGRRLAWPHGHGAAVNASEGSKPPPTHTKWAL